MSEKIPETGISNPKKEIEKLSGYYFFSNFTHEEISLLLLCAEQVCYEEGEVVFRESDIGLRFYAILSGEIVIRRDKSGRELARLKPGKVFGEMAVLDGHPRSATAIAASKAELFAFDGLRLLDNFPHLSVKLLRFMARELSMRVRKADALIDLFV
jgi:CRP/FNR family cyclic AMP-dependent transcriptional regulator